MEAFTKRIMSLLKKWLLEIVYFDIINTKMSPEEGLDTPTDTTLEQVATRESALENLSSEVTQALQGGEYSSVQGSPAETKSVVDKIVEQTGSEFLVLRYAISQEEAAVSKITDGFEAIAPEGSSESLSEKFSAVSNFGQLFETIAEKSDKPVLAILENVQNVQEQGRGDLLRNIRALYNGRARDKSLRNLTWLLTGTASPTELLPQDFGTPYNIGRNFTVPELQRP
ncbi:hypothetical protein IH980_04370 [Patescibacteria group bacterium]|nr:hypothetical protein [Patescibacteria group bacterium]